MFCTPLLPTNEEQLSNEKKKMKSQHLSLHCTSWQLKLFRRRNNVPVCKLLKTYTHVKREMIHSEERDRCDGGACFERRRSYIHACKTREKNRSLFCLISSTDQEIDLEGAIKIRRKRSAIRVNFRLFSAW